MNGLPVRLSYFTPQKKTPKHPGFDYGYHHPSILTRTTWANTIVDWVAQGEMAGPQSFMDDDEAFNLHCTWWNS